MLLKQKRSPRVFDFMVLCVNNESQPQVAPSDRQFARKVDRKVAQSSWPHDGCGVDWFLDVFDDLGGRVGRVPSPLCGGVPHGGCAFCGGGVGGGWVGGGGEDQPPAESLQGRAPFSR